MARGPDPSGNGANYGTRGNYTGPPRKAPSTPSPIRPGYQDNRAFVKGADLNKGSYAENSKAQNNAAADQLEAFFASLGRGSSGGGGGGGRGGGGGAAAYAAYVASVNAQYDNLLRQLGDSKAQAEGGINAAYQGNLDGIKGNYTQLADGYVNTRDQQAATYGAGKTQMQTDANALQASAQALGAPTERIAQQNTANVNTLANQQTLQADLLTRMAKNGYGNLMNQKTSADLVQQGALSRLAADYAAKVNEVNSQRTAAISGGGGGGGGGRSGGGGGGGRSSSTKLTAADRTAMMIDSAYGSGDPNAMLSALFEANPNYAAYMVANGGDLNSALAPYASGQAQQQAAVNSLIAKYRR